MRNKNLTLAMLALTIWGVAARVGAEDWPQWGGNDLGRNMVSPERNLPESFKARPASENVRWAVTLGNNISGNPTIGVAISEGLLYAVDLPGRVHCLDVATGKPQWVYETHAETWGTPMVADCKLFICNKKGLTIGREPRLLASIPLGSVSYGTPVAANGTLFVPSQRSLVAVQASVIAQVVADPRGNRLRPVPIP